MTKEDKNAFSLGAEIGFKTGVIFALEELQRIISTDSVFTAMLSRVWRKFYDDPGTTVTKRIEDLASEHASFLLLSERKFLNKFKEEEKLPLHELIQQEKKQKQNANISEI